MLPKYAGGEQPDVGAALAVLILDCVSTADQEQLDAGLPGSCWNKVAGSVLSSWEGECQSSFERMQCCGMCGVGRLGCSKSRPFMTVPVATCKLAEPPAKLAYPYMAQVSWV
jgi:hypothetical protein